MKKLVICCVDQYTKELLTIARAEKVEYYVEFEDRISDYTFMNKKVYSFEYLRNENKDEVLLIISNSRRYQECADVLMSMGFVEHKHFFNGWKLHSNFYDQINDMNPWKVDESLYSNVFQNDAWEKRAQFMAGMIPNDVESVLDIGCGDQKLRKYLDNNIQYYGLDYMDRGNNTIVCDLNIDPFPEIKVDMYYLAGVFAYIENPQKLIRNMSSAKYILVSLRPTDQFIRLDGHLYNLQFEVYQKMSNDEVINYMFNEGFALVNAQYDYFFQNCHFYLFKKMLDS